MQKKGRFYCIFIDFKRAFDSIQHANLWYSLQRKGINPGGKFLTIFKSMYSQLKSCVKVKKGLTQFFDCHLYQTRLCEFSNYFFFVYK